MTPISKELLAQIFSAATDAARPSSLSKINRTDAHKMIVEAVTPWAAKWEQSERLRKEANALLFPLLEYGQSKEAGIPLGASVTAVILQRAKQFDQAKKALEEIADREIPDRTYYLQCWAEKAQDRAKALLASWKEEGKEGKSDE